MDTTLAGPAGLLPLPLPLPSASGSDGPKPLLKSTSLSRLEELDQYLKQCDDQAYIRRYFKMLSSCPTDVLDEYAKQLKNRAVWLATEEQREYKRAKLLNVMGDPLPAHSADADAFCTRVLEDDFPEEACITPHAAKPGGGASARWQHQGGPPPPGTQQQQEQQQQQAGNEQQQQQQQQRPQSREAASDKRRQQHPAAGVAGFSGGPPAVTGPRGGTASTHGGSASAAPLVSPPVHVTLTDHHPRISPLPSALAPQLQPQPTSRSGGGREGAPLLQTQLQMQPKREQQ